MYAPGTALSPRMNFWSAVTLECYLGADSFPQHPCYVVSTSGPRTRSLRCKGQDVVPGAQMTLQEPFLLQPVLLMALNNSVSLVQACSGLGPGETALWSSAWNSAHTWQTAVAPPDNGYFRGRTLPDS